MGETDSVSGSLGTVIQRWRMRLGENGDGANIAGDRRLWVGQD